MSLRGWLSAGSRHGSTKSLSALDELAQIEDAMAAVTYIMADDVDGAEKHLSKGTSPFHLLGKGVVMFMRATIGFEPDIMRDAQQMLLDAENAAYEQHRKAHRSSNVYQSPIYPPGTEYAVCMAQAQLMGAIVGVLNESLTEAVKGFYKLRKAFLTLDGVMEAEKKFLRQRSSGSLPLTESNASSRPPSRGSSRAKNVALPVVPTRGGKQPVHPAEQPGIIRPPEKEDDEDDFDFVDADEDLTDAPTPMEYMGHLDVAPEHGEKIRLDTSKRQVDVSSSSAPALPTRDTSHDTAVPDTIEDFEQLALTESVRATEDMSLHSNHPVDIFIISGANFCFGILLLIISIVPPAFSTLLKIVGFKGDRERGLKMLWQATKFHNINGAMSGLVIFEYYNGIASFCDIIPRTGPGSYPKERCRLLLNEMRKRYPKSHLFLMGQARMDTFDKQLERAKDFLANMGTTPLRQVDALAMFQRGLLTMFLHRYQESSDAFLKCISLNNWTHALYYYICASCQVELYRHTKISNPAAAKKYAEKAVEYLEKVGPNLGKKKFMARQLPFDVYIARKIQKWEARAKDWGCDLVDAVGVSPLEEMIYFWNGYKVMRPEHLDVSLVNLAWSESSANAHWAKEDLDEKSILHVLRAAVLRYKGEVLEAKRILSSEIMDKDRALFKGAMKDSWTAPLARYEMAANVWREADATGEPEKRPEALQECKKWLVELSSWESYDLDARIGMKITASKGTLRRYGVDC